MIGETHEPLPKEASIETNQNETGTIYGVAPFKEGDWIKSNNHDLRPEGKVEYINGKVGIGGWEIDERGYFVNAPAGMNQETWKRYKELDWMKRNGRGLGTFEPKSQS